MVTKHEFDQHKYGCINCGGDTVIRTPTMHTEEVECQTCATTLVETNDGNTTTYTQHIAVES